MAVQMLSPKQFALYFAAVLILSAIFLSTCSEKSEYGEASDYEKLGAECQNSTGDTSAPTISELSPSDNSTNVPVASKVVVTFSDAMIAGSVTTNTDNTKCSGSLQLSSDDFSTCIKMSGRPESSDNDTIFTVTPASSLSLQTNYKFKITTSVVENSCNTLATDNTTSNGFTTAGPGAGTIKGMVYDDGTGDPLTGVNVQFYGTTIDNTTTVDNGSFNTQVDIGNYIIKYSKTGYADESRQSPLETEGQTLVVPSVRLLPTTGAYACASTGTISGKITDVTDATGSIGIAGVDLIVRADKNISSNPVIATGTTDSSGNYSFSSMQRGWYTVHTSKSGYINTKFFPKSCGDVTFDKAISEELPTTESMRIVLNWDVTNPVTGNDLDSHLQFPDSSGNPEHLHWGVNVNGNQDPGGDYYVYGAADNVSLDRDDKLGPPGTETITIVKVRSGSYSYSVHDFSNYDNASSTNLSISLAYVTVYMGADLPGSDEALEGKIYDTIPAEAGNLWRVFTYTRSGGLTKVETMTYEDTYTDVY